MANKQDKNRQDFGGFGKGVNKAGKPYFYESNKSGGFGIKIIKESDFKKLLKKKESDVAKELRKKIKDDISAKKKADIQLDKLREQKIKDTAKAAAEAENLRELALQKFEDAGIEKRSSVSEKKQNKERVQQFCIELSKHMTFVSTQYQELLDKHAQLSSDSMYKVVSGKVLRLSLEYNKLFMKMDSLYESTRTKSRMDPKANDQIVKFVSNIESLSIKLDSLLIDVNRTEARVEVEKQEKQKKIDEKTAKISAREAARISKTKNKDDKRKDTVRKRRIDAVTNGRAIQNSQRLSTIRQSRIERVERGREIQEQQKQQKIDALQQRREKVDRFFDLNRSSSLYAGKKIGGAVGGFLGGVGNTLGLDFSEESKILSGLFSPVRALSRLGFKGVKSLTQNTLGVGDKEIEQKIEGISNGKAKSIQPNNTTNNSSSNSTNNSSNRSSSVIKNIGKTMMGGAKSVFNNSKNIFGGKNSIFNNSKKQYSNNHNLSSNNSSSTGDKFENTDFNRSDDNKELVDMHPVTTLLEKILKEIKKQNENASKSGLFGSGSSGLMGMIGKAIPVVAALGVGLAVGGEVNDIMDVNNSISNSSQNTKEVILKKLKDKKASKEDVDRVGILLGLEQYTRTNIDDDGAKENLEKFSKERKAIQGKYFINNNVSNTNSTSLEGRDSNSSSFRKDSVKSTISAEVSRIEKIKDIKDDPDERMEKLFKFLGDVFIPKLSDSLANSLISKKSTGKSVMPSIDPF